jgi:16S rRNA (guanine527-N7)-methyltransferase
MDGGSAEARRWFDQGLAGLELDIGDEQVSLLVRYCMELLKWNARINLVARNTTLRDLVDRHFLDSLTLVPLLREAVPPRGPLLDVGSGAGFPGLVVKTACPELTVHLLEPRQRRAAFLRHVIRLLDLENAAVLEQRTDDPGLRIDAPAAVITGRAVADIPEFLAMVRHLASESALVVCMRGRAALREESLHRETSGFRFIGMTATRLPLSGAGRTLLLYRKTA